MPYRRPIKLTGHTTPTINKNVVQIEKQHSLKVQLRECYTGIYVRHSKGNLY
jgi:hypothetical protein